MKRSRFGRDAVRTAFGKRWRVPAPGIVIAVVYTLAMVVLVTTGLPESVTYAGGAVDGVFARRAQNPHRWIDQFA